MKPLPFFAACTVVVFSGVVAGCNSSNGHDPSAVKTTVLHALSADEDSLIGEYGAQGAKGVQPLMRVSHSSEAKDVYKLEEKNRGGWKADKAQGRPLTRAEFAKLVGAGIDVPFTGIVFGQAALIKVPAGWHQGKFSTSTGYILLTFIGPIELTKL